jgi:hypothetical protein
LRVLWIGRIHLLIGEMKKTAGEMKKTAGEVKKTSESECPLQQITCQNQDQALPIPLGCVRAFNR